MTESTPVKKTSAAILLFAWLVVGVPAGWGVYNTVLNARKLFTAAPQHNNPLQK